MTDLVLSPSESGVPASFKCGAIDVDCPPARPRYGLEILYLLALAICVWCIASSLSQTLGEREDTWNNLCEPLLSGRALRGQSADEFFRSPYAKETLARVIPTSTQGFPADELVAVARAHIVVGGEAHLQAAAKAYDAAAKAANRQIDRSFIEAEALVMVSPTSKEAVDRFQHALDEQRGAKSEPVHQQVAGIVRFSSHAEQAAPAVDPPPAGELVHLQEQAVFLLRGRGAMIPLPCGAMLARPIDCPESPPAQVPADAMGSTSLDLSPLDALIDRGATAPQEPNPSKLDFSAIERRQGAEE